MTAGERIVDNLTFLLTLDFFHRHLLRKHELASFLLCALNVAAMPQPASSEVGYRRLLLRIRWWLCCATVCGGPAQRARKTNWAAVALIIDRTHAEEVVVL